MSNPSADKKLIMDFLTWMDTAVDTGIVEVDQYSGQWSTLPDTEIAQYVETFLTLRATVAKEESHAS